MSEHPVDSDFKEISATTLNKLSTSLTKVGYSDGISAGREVAFQEGFDQGYSDGFRLSFQVSAIKAFTQNIYLNEEHIKNTEFLHEIRKFIETDLFKESDKYLRLADSNHQSGKEISEEQQFKTNNLLDKVKTDFPLLCSFINIK